MPIISSSESFGSTLRCALVFWVKYLRISPADIGTFSTLLNDALSKWRTRLRRMRHSLNLSAA